LQADQLALSTASSDLSNVETPGFLALVTTNVGDPIGSTERVGGSTGPAVISAPFAQGTAAITTISAAPSAVQTTGVPTDLAVTGPSFLTIHTARGIAYTRDGQLHWTAQGHLVTAAGDPVLTTAHTPVTLTPNRAFTVSAAGVIAQAGHPNQTLALVDLTPGTTLTDTGQAQYQGTPQPFTGTVIQGALNGSNVSLDRTITNLLMAQTAYQANAQALNEEGSRLATVAQLGQLSPAP